MPKRYTSEDLVKAVLESTTWAEVCRKVGVKPMTGSQTYVKSKALKLNLDFSHFVGRNFNLGRTFPEHRRPIEYYLKLNGPFINSHLLKKKLIASGLKKASCEECGISKWRDQDLPLELDHINRNSRDNRFKNLKVSCPNCHAIKTRKDRKQARLAKLGRRVRLRSVFLNRSAGSIPVAST